MNEPANFCNGECTWNDGYDSGKKDEYLNANITLPYIPGGFSDLNYKSLPINLKHYGGLLHKDVHNLYG